MPLRTDSYRKNTKNTQNSYNHEINHKSEQNVEVKTSKLRNTASNDSVPRQKSSSFPVLLWIKSNIRGMHWIRHQFTLFKSCLVKFLLRSQRVAPLICRLLGSDKLIQMLLATSTLALDLWNFKEQSSQCLCSVLILISQCVISILAWASKLVLLWKGWESSLQAGTAEEGDEEIQAWEAFCGIRQLNACKEQSEHTHWTSSPWCYLWSPSRVRPPPWE